MTPAKQLHRLIATYEDTHGVGRNEARAAVLATDKGKALVALSAPQVTEPTARIAKAVADKWRTLAPNETPLALVIRSLVGGPLVVARVEGMPPRLAGMAIPSHGLGEPPIVVLKAGLHAALEREVFGHELAHLIFDARLVRDMVDVEARADEAGALIVNTLSHAR